MSEALAGNGDCVVLRLEDQDGVAERQWDRFVRACPEATFFHRAGWRHVIGRAFGHDSHYLYTREGDALTGILPLGHVKSAFFGNALISVPFAVYGGCCAVSPQARDALMAAARELARRLGVDYLELREREALTTGGQVKDLYVTFRKTIGSDPEENLKAIPRKQRAMIRKGIKAGLRSHLDTDTDRFFRVYSESVRNLGTPVYAARYFSILHEVFREDCEILTVTHDGRPLASVMSFYFRNEVLPYYGGGTVDARRFKGNDFMYWELMRRAGERGIEIFDFGRSKKGTGAYSFKKNWGFEPQEMPYRYHLIRSAAMPDINPMNPKYRLFVSMWKKLPLPVANFIGPLISRGLG